VQDNIFLNGEGDRWFERNENKLGAPEMVAEDWPLILIARHGLCPQSVVTEVGCANGWRLDWIREVYGARCYGIDASRQAIEDGRQRFPSVDYLTIGAISDLRVWRDSIWCNHMADLVICHYVLHWIDRGSLLQSISEIDRILSPGGYLLLGDFLPDRPTKVRYHHRQDVELWTYKQDYAATFLATGGYVEVDRMIYDHDSHEQTKNIPSHRRGVCSLLRKEETYCV